MPFYRVIFEEKHQHEVTVEADNETQALSVASAELDADSEDVETTFIGVEPILVQDEETF